MEGKIMVVDAGGRGNIIAKKFSESQYIKEVIVAPGNGGSEILNKCRRVKVSSIKAIGEIIKVAQDEGVEFIFVGPEASIGGGIADEAIKRGIGVVAPTKRAAILETSKCWTKDYLKKIGVPIPDFQNFNNPYEAKEFVRENPEMRVVKADGICEGKGTFVCNSLEQTLKAIDTVTSKEFNDKYNGAGKQFEIEKKLEGEELSFFAVADGENGSPFGTAKDYKRAFADKEVHPSFLEKWFGGINPNTGGMGGYSPHLLGESLQTRIMEEIVRPTYDNFPYKKEYKGILHFVLMIVEENGKKQIKVLEINAREGDPEGEVRLPRLRSDFYEISRAILDGNLQDLRIDWSLEFCFGVCLVSGAIWKSAGGVSQLACEGYPGKHFTRQEIFVIPSEIKNPEEYRYPKRIAKVAKKAQRDFGSKIFVNGAEFDEKGNLLTSGGRVLTVVDMDKDFKKAGEKIYRAVNRIYFNGARFRKDIGS